MIQQVNVMQQTTQPAVKQTTRSTNDDFEKHLVGENGESGEITVNNYGNKVKFGMDIGTAELGEYFTKEQIEEWTKSIDNVDAPYSAFLTFVMDAQEHDNTAGKVSMNYFDFRYLLEQGEIINQQNVGFTEEYIYERNWDFSVMLTETFGIRNTEQNKQHLDIIRSVMDLGMCMMRVNMEMR